MAQRIEGDAARFRNIVRGKVKEQLKGYISNGEMIGKKARDLVPSRCRKLRCPRFATAAMAQAPARRPRQLANTSWRSTSRSTNLAAAVNVSSDATSSFVH